MCSLMLMSLPLVAKDRPFLDEPEYRTGADVQADQWQEAGIGLPQTYREEDLQEFQPGEPSGRFRYFIDRSSLQSDTDGVIRVILVIRSAEGVDNSTYEGFRCGAREYKVYAYGGRQGFQAIPKPSWRRISRSSEENYRNTLYENLLCNLDTGEPNPPQAVIQAIQHQTTVKSSPFLQD
jgi:hypothetical protein